MEDHTVHQLPGTINDGASNWCLLTLFSILELVTVRIAQMHITHLGINSILRVLDDILPALIVNLILRVPIALFWIYVVLVAFLAACLPRWIFRPIRWIQTAFNCLFRFPLMLALACVVFAFEYVCVREQEQVENDLTQPRTFVTVTGFIACLLGVGGVDYLCKKLYINVAYNFIWSQINKLARKGREYFPNLITLQLLDVLKSAEDLLPIFSVLLLIAPAMVLYLVVLALVPTYLYRDLFYVHVAGFYLKSNSAVYGELEVDEPTIRLLTLIPGQGLEPIRCELHEADVHNDKFEALSYTWGGHLVLRCRILVNGKRFWVTRNVFLALHSLRQQAAVRTLWIDQICINQTNDNEKTDQVTHKMHHIYRNAERVIVWLGSTASLLGPSASTLSSAFERAKKYPGKRFEDEDGECRDDRNLYRDAWIAVFERRWFSRVWVVQEVALAKEIIVKCGVNEMDWETLKRTAMDLREVHNLPLPRNAGALIHFIEHFKKAPRSLALLNLAIRFCRHETSNAPDKLLGLLALANDSQTYPDLKYGLRATSVFANFTVAQIQCSQSLEILPLAETSKGSLSETMECSWAPRWDAMPSDPPQALWGLSVGNSKISAVAKYSASADRPAVCRRESKSALGHPVKGIFLRGWYLDTVEAVSVEGSISDMETIKRIWREFVYTQIPDAANAETMFKSIIVGNIPNGPNLPQDLASDFAIALCNKRRLFITAQRRLGIEPHDTGAGDHICVFDGSGVPHVVRGWLDTMRVLSSGYFHNSNFDHTKAYRLLGQTVLSGCMYVSSAEIEKQLQTGSIEIADILLR